MKAKKFLAVLLALLMLAMTIPFATLTASAAVADEYVTNATQITNDYLKLIVTNDTRHVLYTTGGNPDSATDNNKKLLYDATSDAIINVDGRIWDFSSSTSRRNHAGDSLYAVQTANGVRVERLMSFVYNTYTSRYDTVEYKYIITNVSNTSLTAGIRMFFDTMLGSNDQAPFRVNGQNVTTGRTYEGDAIPQTWQVFDNFNNPTVVASGTFYKNVDERPDKVQFLSYGAGSGTQWDCAASGTIGDSAVNVYFNPISLAPGESRTVKTYYGLSEFQPNDDDDDDDDILIPHPGMSFSAMSPNEMETNGSGTAYLGNPFIFSGWIRSTGNMPLTNVKATVTLSSGLSTPNTTIDVGTLAAGTEYGFTLPITVAATEVGTTRSYTLTVTADDVEPIINTYTIYVPALIHHHNYDVVLNDVPSTCTQAGYVERMCSACGNTNVAYRALLPHDYVSEVQTAASCTTPGVIRHTCSGCGDSYATYVYAEHHYSEIEYVAATCEVDGYHLFKCDTCEDEYTVAIPGGHSYEAEVTKRPTANENGEITYTCANCGHYYIEILPMRPDANILLVQDRLPWTENANTNVLNRLLDGGYIDGWDMTTTSAFEHVDLAQYSIIFIANDQTTTTYNRLASFNERIAAFAAGGGVVVYGACDHGWAGGNISYSLPGGVTKGNYYSYRNYIVNPTHNVVTGVLTDGRALTDEILYSTYSSHTYFNNLPDNAISILSDANGRPTLVEYPYGDGYIIASGLTWEYTYVRNYVAGTSFAKNVYDDLLMHAVMMSDPCDHAYGEGTVVAPNCTEKGYTYYECVSCGMVKKDNFVDALGHTPGEWVVVTEPTTETAGLKQKVCITCGEVVETEILPIIDAAVIRVEAPSDTVIIGQEMTFSVIVAGCDPVTAMGLTVMFDEDIFDLVCMDWTSINAFMKDTNLANRQAVAAWTAPANINTMIYTITLRAKALTDATQVDSEVRLEGQGGIMICSVVPKTVAVIECPHASGTHTAMDDEYHVFTCDICGYSALVAHTYDSVCDTTCNDCGYARTAPHAYEVTWTNNATEHWHKCALCGMKADQAAHDFDNACDPDCAVCGYTRAVAHEYNGTWSSDYENHWHACTLCGGAYTDMSTHVYDGICDDTCNVCAYERFGAKIVLRAETYTNIKSGGISIAYDSDVFEIIGAQWLLPGTLMADFTLASGEGVFAFADTATISGSILELTVRVKDMAAWRTALTTLYAELVLVDVNHTQTTQPLDFSHVVSIEPLYCHSFTVQNADAAYLATSASCTARARYYYSCEVCGAQGTDTFEFGEMLPHTYDDVCDIDCNECGGQRVAPHAYAAEWSTDDAYHWHACALCGDMADHAEHVYDDATDLICDVCDFARYLVGDVDNDGDKDSSDAIYLLYRVIFGAGSYPTYQPLDFNGDGDVNSMDAIYLLYNVIFGNATYPLHSER